MVSYYEGIHAWPPPPTVTLANGDTMTTFSDETTETISFDGLTMTTVYSGGGTTINHADGSYTYINDDGSENSYDAQTNRRSNKDRYGVTTVTGDDGYSATI